MSSRLFPFPSSRLDESAVRHYVHQNEWNGRCCYQLSIPQSKPQSSSPPALTFSEKREFFFLSPFCRVLVFPPVNNYRRFIIHQLIQDRFPALLHTFSIGQGSARRTVVCYKSDVRRYRWQSAKTSSSQLRGSLSYESILYAKVFDRIINM